MKFDRLLINTNIEPGRWRLVLKFHRRPSVIRFERSGLKVSLQEYSGWPTQEDLEALAQFDFIC